MSISQAMQGVESGFRGVTTHAGVEVDASLLLKPGYLFSVAVPQACGDTTGRAIIVK